MSIEKIAKKLFRDVRNSEFSDLWRSDAGTAWYNVTDAASEVSWIIVSASSAEKASTQYNASTGIHLKFPSKQKDFSIFLEIMRMIRQGVHQTPAGLRRMYVLKQKMH